MAVREGRGASQRRGAGRFTTGSGLPARRRILSDASQGLRPSR
jgi:hypothetical protein